MTLISYRRVNEKQLRNLWQQLPQESQGYLINLKKLAWHQCKPEKLPAHTHEGRLFGKGHDLHWRRVQYYDGKQHVYGYNLVCIGLAANGGKRIQAEPDGKKASLMLWKTPLPGNSEPRVGTRAWVREGLPVFHQWILLNPEETSHDAR